MIDDFLSKYHEIILKYINFKFSFNISIRRIIRFFAPNCPVTQQGSTPSSQQAARQITTALQFKL